MSVTPCGFARTPEKGLARLHWAGDDWAVDGRPADVPALRPLRGLEIEWPDAEVPELAELALDGLLRLAAAGIPLTADRAARWVPADLAALLTDRAWLGHAADGTARCLADLRREEHSIRLRRLAHPTPAPKISIVMSSKRPGLVGAALAQMERQRDVAAEVLLGLHGAAFEQVRAAVESCALPVKWVEAEASVPFGEVLNRAAALASGDYLAKWDDDDWYGPRHLADLAMALTYASADVVGTTAEFFYLEPLRATIRRTTFASGAGYPSEVWSDHVAGGTIMLSLAKFREIGGFPPISRAVDLEFLKAAQRAGTRIYRTHGLGYVLRRGLSAEHTWQLPLAHFLKVAANQWRGFRPSLLMEAA
ncbi:glycosyltransferase family 2 protein [Nonomuraea turkmeniaca]|uniref:Glycosyltransferase family 2 protein n=1 Tax=Nonomuraea turkmeniaca TaxID=103838 RepID=A0A5S4EXC9_9ACTN|nr:glycosyltransferase family 2 protein [Nonomuraea turkmeniaca]TMR08220.1 glycosyltransferase family 2 protein [Nonomuraea turkmeniaca]